MIQNDIDSQFFEKTISFLIQQSRIETALRESEARFRSVVQNLSDIITIIDADSIISYVSPSVEQKNGLSVESVVGQKFTDFVHPDDFLKIESFIKSLKNENSKDLMVEWQAKDFSGKYHYVESVGTNLLDDVHVSGLVITTRNVEVRKNLEAKLAHQALHDPLTNLANRILFRDRVEHALTRIKRLTSPLAVLFLDLDNFKNINDSLGHAAGDELVKTFTERLLTCVRFGDTVARLGGDEFAVLLEDADQLNNAIDVAKRVLDCANEPYYVRDRCINIGISIGIAISYDGKETADELLRNADVAMYDAKSKGKGCYAIFESKMHETILSQVELEADFRRAIENHEFVLNYQPIVRLDSQNIAGFEALVRWNHPKLGLLQPESFIPLAEQTGLISPLGKWVIEESCRQSKRLSDYYHRNFTMTINISGKQLQNADFASNIVNALDSSKTVPSSIILEITESVMMQNTEVMLHRLKDLKKLGVRLAIDDFGTGYSSLSYLQQFPIDILKIDKSFIDEVNKGFEKSAVARTILSLSDTLQLSTIAEGIENTAQIATLQKLGCKFGQGFYFAKPLNENQLAEISQIENLNIDFEKDQLIYPELKLIFNKGESSAEYEQASKVAG